MEHTGHVEIFRSKWSTSRGPKLAVPLPKIIVSSRTLLSSSQNFGRNVNGSLDSIRNFVSTEKRRSIFSLDNSTGF